MDILRQHLFPGRWNPARDWPRIRAARLETDRLVIPEVYRTASGQRQPWRAVAVRSVPPDVWRRGMGKDEIVLDVQHPPGAGEDGAILDRAALAELRAQSGPRYRAYIGGHSLIWLPGKTRVWHRGKWYWARDPLRYAVLTDEDRARIAFASVGERRKLSRAEMSMGIENGTRWAASSEP